MPRWPKLRELSWSERGYLLFATCALPVVGAGLRLAGFERSVGWLRRSSSRLAEGKPAAAELDWARKRAYLISIAARFSPYRATCLRRSFLLWWTTRRRGLASRLRIGVRRSDDELLAHAWIELEGEILNDRTEVVDTYAVFDADRLPDEVSWT